MKRRTNRITLPSCWEQLRAGKAWQRLSLALLATLLLTMTAQTAQAEVTYTYNSSSKTLTIGGEGVVSSSSVYSSIDEVEEDPSDALMHVVIGNDITGIGENAFLAFKNLQTVEIGSGVETIGNNVFNNCISLSSVTIPNSVTTIGEYAFKGCTGLNSITIGSGVETIGDNAFADVPSTAKVYVLPLTHLPSVITLNSPLSMALIERL